LAVAIIRDSTTPAERHSKRFIRLLPECQVLYALECNHDGSTSLIVARGRNSSDVFKTASMVYRCHRIAVFLGILLNLDIPVILATLLSVNIYYLTAALLVNGLIVVIKAKKWNIIVDSIRPGFTLRQSIIGFLVGFSLSTLTPGKVGEAVRCLYVKNDSCTTSMGLSTVAIDRIIDLAILFAFGTMALIAVSAIAV
jgi:uncharacterized membrane protein YbhN (UPF0104 family)